MTAELQGQPLPSEDTTWADKYGIALRPVCLRFGRKVFEFTMAVGVTQHAVQTIMRRVAGNRELTKAMTILASNCNNFATLYMNLAGLAGSFAQCKAAIEATTPNIIVPEQAGHSIILPS